MLPSGGGDDELIASHDRDTGQQMADICCPLTAWFRREPIQRLTARIPDTFTC